MPIQTIDQIRKRADFTKVPPEGCPFVVGQRVVFTNDQGVTFGPLRVYGFDVAPHYGRAVYILKDSYWMPVRVDSLRAHGIEAL
jgi:hypothetical protein